jgi:hypothetical protein
MHRAGHYQKALHDSQAQLSALRDAHSLLVVEHSRMQTTVRQRTLSHRTQPLTRCFVPQISAEADAHAD